MSKHFVAAQLFIRAKERISFQNNHVNETQSLNYHHHRWKSYISPRVALNWGTEHQHSSIAVKVLVLVIFLWIKLLQWTVFLLQSSAFETLQWLPRTLCFLQLLLLPHEDLINNSSIIVITLRPVISPNHKHTAASERVLEIQRSYFSFQNDWLLTFWSQPHKKVYFTSWRRTNIKIKLYRLKT